MSKLLSIVTCSFLFNVSFLVCFEQSSASASLPSSPRKFSATHAGCITSFYAKNGTVMWERICPENARTQEHETIFSFDDLAGASTSLESGHIKEISNLSNAIIDEDEICLFFTQQDGSKFNQKYLKISFDQSRYSVLEKGDTGYGVSLRQCNDEKSVLSVMHLTPKVSELSEKDSHSPKSNITPEICESEYGVIPDGSQEDAFLGDDGSICVPSSVELVGSPSVRRTTRVPVATPRSLRLLTACLNAPSCDFSTRRVGFFPTN